MKATEYDSREIPHADIVRAPAITFGQFRKMAGVKGWTLEELVERFRDELDHPTDTLRRILEGARIDGRQEKLDDVVIPYRCLIELYQRALQPAPAVPGEPLCPCGCGRTVVQGRNGQGKWASDACRKRAVRRQSSKNLGHELTQTFFLEENDGQNDGTLPPTFTPEEEIA